MVLYDRRYWTLATLLAVLAGYVDAIGFLKLGGLFVSFMSGNSTRFAVGLAEKTAATGIAASLVAAFLAGVVAGSLLSALTRSARKTAVLAMVSLLLSCSALLDRAAGARWAPLAMAAAMGAANCVFQRDGEVSIGVTYMTGALVKLGQRLAAALLGFDRFAWLPYLILWSGLVAGAITGASLYPRIGSISLWAAAVAAAALALLARRLGPAQPIRKSAAQ